MSAAEHIVVVLTGQFGAGCTTVAEYLETEEKFGRYSFSAIIQEAAKERLGAAEYDGFRRVQKRTELQNQGNTLREADPAAIAEEIIAKIKGKGDGDTDVVVETVRNPAEIAAFRQAFGDRVFVVSLDASLAERFKRSHGDYGDDLQQFKKDDARDKGEGEPEHGQRTQECVYLADISINNHGHMDSQRDWNRFFVNVQDYLRLMREPASRPPTYPELYMRQAYAVSLKSTCTKRQVGVVLVREESYVIATGYNDVPIREPSCREMGPPGDPRFCPKDDEEEQKLRAMRYCPTCGAELSIPPGKVTSFRCEGCDTRLPRDLVPGRMLDVCRAVHAEEAAIVQAAKLGSTSLAGATLYSTTFPCLLCAKSIINAGIEKVVYHEPYPMDDSVAMLGRCDVTLDKYEGVNAWAFDRMFKGTLD